MHKGQGAGDGRRGKTGSPTPHAPRPSPQRILVIGPSNIGDAVLASDVVARLRRRFPNGHLTLVVGARAKTLFLDDPRIQTLMDLEAFSSWLGRVQLASLLWRYHPQVVVDLRHTLYPLLLKPLAAWRYVLPPPGHVHHMRQRHLWTLRVQTSLPTSSVEAEGEGLWVSEQDHAHIDGLWRRWHLGAAQRVVLVCPGARSHLKRWSAEGFARVADRLIVEAQVAVVFGGEPDEEPIVESIRELMRERALSAIGLTTIRQVVALMRRAQLVITNDSASLHVASAVDVPTVAIFGPTDEVKYGPTSLRHRVIRRRLFCAPCEQAQCRFNHECMRFISPDEVYNAAIELLGQRAGSKG